IVPARLLLGHETTNSGAGSIRDGSRLRDSGIAYVESGDGRRRFVSWTSVDPVLAEGSRSGRRTCSASPGCQHACCAVDDRQRITGNADSPAGPSTQSVDRRGAECPPARAKSWRGACALVGHVARTRRRRRRGSADLGTDHRRSGHGASSTSRAPPPAAPSPPAPATTSFTFPATCKVLGPLRLQDIATQRDALFGALASDGFTYMETKLVGGNAEASKIAVGTVLTSVIVPLVARPKLLADNAQAQAVVGEVLAYVDTIDSGNDVVSEDTVKTLRPAQTALVAGVLAF